MDEQSDFDLNPFDDLQKAINHSSAFDCVI